MTILVSQDCAIHADVRMKKLSVGKEIFSLTRDSIGADDGTCA